MDVETALAGNQNLFEEVRELLTEEQEPRFNPWLILVISLALFVGSMFLGFSLHTLVAIIVILLFHELGHWFGMLIFGYRNLSIFFIPFFGAAASGKKEGAPGWQEAIVFMLGPLPGIIIGVVLAFLQLAFPLEPLHTAAMWLIGINAFNLLPVFPLDGGRLLNLLLFCRHHTLEVVFLLIASAALAGLGILMEAWILVLFAFFQLAAIAPRYRVVKAALALQEQFPNSDWCDRPAELDEEQLKALFAAAMTIQTQGTGEGKTLANQMRSIHERILIDPPSPAATIGFLVLYGSTWILALIGVVVLAIPAPA
jgi:Zn-dependent protease